MTLVRRVARPMLAAMFVVGGLDQLKHPARKAETARPLVEKFAPTVGLPDDAELLVRANGVAMVTAGSLLALGRLPRIASAVLAATIVPTTVAAHAFWNEKDPEVRAQQKDAVPQEPRPARRPAPRRGRHRGQARPGVPRQARHRQRAPRGPHHPPGGPARRPRGGPRGEAEGGPGTACPRLTGRHRPRPGRSTHGSSSPAASPSPTATSSSRPSRTTSPACGRRCARATPSSWRGPCAPSGARVEDVDDGDWVVTPGRLVGGGEVDCGLAGNVMRFVPPVAGLADGPGAVRR